MSKKEFLNKKVKKEYRDFIKQLNKKSKNEIIKRAPEITVKKELKDFFQNMDLQDIEIDALLAEDNSLNKFYKDWQNMDLKLCENLNSPITYSINNITNDYMHKPKQVDGLADFIARLETELNRINKHWLDICVVDPTDTDIILDYLRQLDNEYGKNER